MSGTGRSKVFERTEGMLSTPVALNRIEVVVIGTSAGGVAALKQIVARLPGDFPVPIIIAQHCAAQKPDLLAAVLRATSKLRVKEAENGEQLWPGCIYLAPAARHVAIEQFGYISVRNGDKIRYSRPSIDLLFSSAAETYRDRILGIVLTGANADGALGVCTIDLLGGIVIAQQGAEYPQMPTAAVATGAVHHELPLETLCSAMIALCMLPGAARWMQRFTGLN